MDDWQKDLADVWESAGFSYAHDTMARKVEGVFKKYLNKKQEA